MARIIRNTPLPHQVPPPGDWTLWLVTGGRGIGKSYLASTWLVRNALKYPGTSWRAVGRTWGEVRAILAEGPSGVLATVDRLGVEDLLQGGSRGTAYRRSPGDLAVTFANGSVISFASAEKPDSLRGFNGHGAVADEVAFWPEESWDMLQFSIRMPLPDGTPSRIVATTTPKGRNWLYERYVAAAPQPGVVFIGGGDVPPSKPPSTFDNPYLDDGFIRAVRSRYEGTDLGRQELYGDWLSFAGAIYKGLGDETVRTPGMRWPSPDDCDEVIAGQDLGTEHPSALVVLARQGERWHAVAEVVKPAATEADWNDDIAATVARWKPGRIYSDRNFPQTTTAQQRRGLPIVLADKSPGSVLDGIRAVQAMVSAGQLVIDVEACPTLWRQLVSYRWQMGSDGNALVPERPVKADDDAPDALRYAIHAVAMPKRRLLFS
jgi:phage terminase large subunit-like protein